MSDPMTTGLRPDDAPSSVYQHSIGHVYASGGQSSIDVSAENGWLGWKGRKVGISRTWRGPDREYETARAMINPEAAALLARVLGDIDDWAEITALADALHRAAAYEGEAADGSV